MLRSRRPLPCRPIPRREQVRCALGCRTVVVCVGNIHTGNCRNTALIQQLQLQQAATADGPTPPELLASFAEECVLPCSLALGSTTHRRRFV